MISSADANGRADTSPRDDPPGFVAVLDKRTLLIPDRPGNNQIDSLQNIIAHPHVGLLFLVLGMNETLRVSGTAKITTDPALLKPLCVDGKHPSPMRISVNSTSGPRANKARIFAKFARGGRSINLYKDLKNGKST